MKLGFKASALWNRFRRVLEDRHVKTRLKIYPAEALDERVNLLWREAASRYDFIVVRDATYLKWRYLDPRAGDYTILLAEEGQSLQGYIVLHINRTRENYPIGYIVDLLTPPERSDVRLALVRRALEFFRKHDVNIVTTLAIKGHPHERAFRRAGFINSRKRLNLFLGTHGLKARDQKTVEVIKHSRPDKTHFTYGDIDSLPIDLPTT
jgi:hypothetical protein